MEGVSASSHFPCKCSRGVVLAGREALPAQAPALALALANALALAPAPPLALTQTLALALVALPAPQPPPCFDVYTSSSTATCRSTGPQPRATRLAFAVAPLAVTAPAVASGDSATDLVTGAAACVAAGVTACGSREVGGSTVTAPAAATLVAVREEAEIDAEGRFVSLACPSCCLSASGICPSKL